MDDSCNPVSPPKVLQNCIHTMVFEECSQHDIRHSTQLHL